MGGALAIALGRAGFRIENLIFRTHDILSAVAERIEPKPHLTALESISSIGSDIVLITTADPDIAAAASQIRSKIASTSVVLHTSGALSSEVLSPVRKLNVSAGSMHPLVSVSDPVTGADSFSGAYFCLEGDTAAVDAARKMVAGLKGQSFTVDTRYKPLYHAAAVMAAGHLVALIDSSLDVLAACGIEESTARAAILPLIESSVGNLRRQGPANALTGPFARADLPAIERHIRAFDEKEGLEMERAIYLELGLKAVELAERGGGDVETLKNIRQSILMAKRSSK